STEALWQYCHSVESADGREWQWQYCCNAVTSAASAYKAERVRDLLFDWQWIARRPWPARIAGRALKDLPEHPIRSWNLGHCPARREIAPRHAGENAKGVVIGIARGDGHWRGLAREHVRGKRDDPGVAHLLLQARWLRTAAGR